MSDPAVLCPYCGHDLKVLPQRRRKCPSCKQLFYVKSTPDRREKRLMTEAEALEAEQLWASYRERQEALAALHAVGIDEGELEVARNRGAKSDSDAVLSILTRLAESAPNLHTRKMAFHFLAVAAERRNQPALEYWTNAIKCELLRYKESGIALVKVSKPKPWAPAAEMVRLHEDGLDVDAIARITGYSVPTVERNIRTRGEDRRAGPHCERYAKRIFFIQEALDEMPLPCGEECVCMWHPILPSDLEREGN